MKKKTIICFSLMFNVLLNCNLFSQTYIPYKISAIKAFLFYNQDTYHTDADVTGTLSENIIDNNDFSLYNSFIGEGSSEGISIQTLIIVDIIPSIKHDTIIYRNIEMTAMRRDMIIYKESVEIIFMENKKFSIAFLLNDPGGVEISVKADIIDSTNKIESTLTKIIPYDSGGD